MKYNSNSSSNRSRSRSQLRDYTRVHETWLNNFDLCAKAVIVRTYYDLIASSVPVLNIRGF